MICLQPESLISFLATELEKIKCSKRTFVMEMASTKIDQTLSRISLAKIWTVPLITRPETIFIKLYLPEIAGLFDHGFEFNKLTQWADLCGFPPVIYTMHYDRLKHKQPSRLRKTSIALKYAEIDLDRAQTFTYLWAQIKQYLLALTSLWSIDQSSIWYLRQEKFVGFGTRFQIRICAWIVLDDHGFDLRIFFKAYWKWKQYKIISWLFLIGSISQCQNMPAR